MSDSHDQERLQKVEERLAHTERSDEMRDKEMLELSRQIQALEARLKRMQERLEALEEGGENLPHEKPPHY